MVSNIEKIKIATIQGYNMNPELLSELDNIQSSVLDKASILSNISLYIKQVET